ncbi:MAG TPA: hypothetical protein VM735_06540, partial [Candidatus Kapabacteria bacterium]|nr:hypothetical protein [Candidatus Kapabacteria bacterium]
MPHRESNARVSGINFVGVGRKCRYRNDPSDEKNEKFRRPHPMTLLSMGFPYYWHSFARVERPGKD